MPFMWDCSGWHVKVAFMIVGALHVASAAPDVAAPPAATPKPTAAPTVAPTAAATAVPIGLVSWQNLAAIALASAGQKPSCFNPLFRTHWAGKSDIRHLGSRPQVQQGLKLCPGFNARQGCCLNSFEHVLAKAFQRWVRHWKRKSNYIQNFQIQMAKIKVSQSYVKGSKLQRALFDKAMSSFALVLKWHGTCFDTLLEYIAGTLCFACDPNWGQKVFFGEGKRTVEHLHVRDYSNEALWQSCRRLGSAAIEMQARVADSLLAKGILSRFEDLSMFSTKVSVSQYMSRIGLFPLRGVSENQLILRGASRQDRRLLIADPTDFVDPVRVGRTSGFQCAVFPRIPFGFSIGSPGASAMFPWLLIITFGALSAL